jgi:hypothetical protein
MTADFILLKKEMTTVLDNTSQLLIKSDCMHANLIGAKFQKFTEISSIHIHFAKGNLSHRIASEPTREPCGWEMTLARIYENLS